MDEKTPFVEEFISKLHSRGYDVSLVVDPDVESVKFKESLNNLEPEDYLICVGESCKAGLSVLEKKLRSIECAFFIVLSPISFKGSLKAKKVYLYGDENVNSLADNLEVEPFVDEELSVLFEEVLIDIISLEH